MIIMFVYIVFMCMLVIKSEDNIVQVRILKEKNTLTCQLERNITLALGNNFTLKIQSDYFIKESSWTYYGNKKQPKNHILENLRNSNISLIYKKNNNTTLSYVLVYTRNVEKKLKGTWNFKFTLVDNYNPWLYQQIKPLIKSLICKTTVTIDSTMTTQGVTVRSGVEQGRSASGSPVNWAAILSSVGGLMLLTQTVYIIYIKMGARAANVLRKHKKGREINIADRPPLPLPKDAETMDEPRAPVAPVSPIPRLNSSPEPPIPSAPHMTVQRPYVTNHAPLQRHMPSMQTYRNKAFDISDEAVQSPGFARRQYPVKQPQSPPYPSACVSKSFKIPKPTPRSPSPPLQKSQGIQPTYRKAPAPPLFPKTSPVYPTDHIQHQVQSMNSDDDEWQYEQLQPTLKYTNNYSS